MKSATFIFKQNNHKEVTSLVTVELNYLLNINDTLKRKDPNLNHYNIVKVRERFFDLSKPEHAITYYCDDYTKSLPDLDPAIFKNITNDTVHR
ncbi:hypothetical protein BT049_RS03015 [Vibrio parahaemolyticus]|nr:hypothetical protein [Vibrio parahaemolyticus]ELA7161138.1 hypothetical protein [Vibrio parahaemolyticus]MDG3002070.1 hypothetical protein [Vibrio parahaemolyticus]MDG3039549.1 hypothetical protein [Vibrio parahaemolyticus]